MERKCLEKWNGQTVLVLGHIDRKKYSEQGQLHLCLKDCQVALYGEGKLVKIDHVWIFTNLQEEELALFDHFCPICLPRPQSHRPNVR